jgi:transcriptional regulator with XRE-family HTH domain
MVRQEGVPELLRRLREQRGESLRSVARSLGVTPSYLSRVERGEKAASLGLQERASSYYGIESEMLTAAGGLIPEDIVEILRRHPKVIAELRERYGETT